VGRADKTWVRRKGVEGEGKVRESKGGVVVNLVVGGGKGKMNGE